MAQVLLQSFFPQLSSCVQRSSYLWNLLNSSCNIPYIASKQFPLNFITFPELAVVCVIGVLIGIIGGRLLVAGAKSIKHYSFHYGLSFFFYSIMCGSGLGYHCVFPPQAYIMATGANLPFTVCRITQICHCKYFYLDYLSKFNGVIDRVGHLCHIVLESKFLVCDVTGARCIKRERQLQNFTILCNKFWNWLFS
jgi:hypothetical protein